MKTYPVILVAAGVFLCVACGKNKFTTIPQLKIKSISTDVVPLNGTITFKIQFTDKEGDVKDTLFIKKVRLNKKVVATIRDLITYVPPSFPDSKKGEFIVDLGYQNILSAITPPTIPGTVPPQKESDTLLVKFVVRDSQGNKSDTVTSSQVIVIRN
jgi:hypothetical protein